MTIQEVTVLVQNQWMAKSVEERIRAAGDLYEAEKALLESLAPPPIFERSED